MSRDAWTISPTNEGINSGCPTDIRRALDDVAQALSVIAPVTARVLEKLGSADEDAAALENSVDRAIRAIRRLQPRESELVVSSFLG
jgi:hypothetical protein